MLSALNLIMEEDHFNVTKKFVEIPIQFTKSKRFMRWYEIYVNDKLVGQIHFLENEKHKYRWVNYELDETGYADNYVIGSVSIIRPIFEKWAKIQEWKNDRASDELFQGRE